MAVSYWYLAPLSRVLHSSELLLWKEVTIAQYWSAHSEERRMRYSEFETTYRCL